MPSISAASARAVALPVVALLLLARQVVGCVPTYQFEDDAGEDGGAGDATVESSVAADGGADDVSVDASTVTDASDGSETSSVTDAGADGDAPADGSTSSNGCPATPGTTPMVRFDDPPRGSFCIDTKEVTVQQFNDFVLAPNPVFTVPPICAGESDDGGLPTPSDADPTLPAGYVSLCDAWAYCSWANKRLCGGIGGQHSSGTGNTTSDEWAYACANGAAATTYPYGTTFDADTCNTGTLDAGATLQPPGSFPGCHGTSPGFDQLFDMSGNVAEYDDWAETYTGTGLVAVHTVGGSYENDGPNTCNAPSAQFGQATRAFADTGFRCCATP